MTVALAKIIAAVSAPQRNPTVCSGFNSVAWRGSSGVYECYLKGIMSVYFRRLAKMVTLEHTFLFVRLQPTKLSDACSSTTHLLARWEHNRITAW